MDAQNASKLPGNGPYSADAEIWLRREHVNVLKALCGDFVDRQEIRRMVADLMAQDLPERDRLAKAYEAGRNTPA